MERNLLQKRKLEMHCKLVHEKGNFKCDECKFNFETKSTLYSYRYTKHRSKSSKYKYCENEFPNSQLISRHISEAHQIIRSIKIYV